MSVYIGFVTMEKRERRQNLLLLNQVEKKELTYQ
jgi:hypothetical protein